MDKTLEIVMVAVALVVSIVIVTGILQGQSNKFGEFSQTQTEGSSCSVTTSQLKSYCAGNTGGASWDQTPAQNLASSSSCSSLTPNDVC